MAASNGQMHGTHLSCTLKTLNLLGADRVVFDFTFVMSTSTVAIRNITRLSDI